MLVIGLTGSIAMGKSTTAAAFADLGIPVFDADRAVHDLYRGAAAPLVEAAFPGTTGPDGVDRQKLGGVVLGDPAALRRLEGIVHPLVRQAEAAFLAAAAGKGHRLAVLDVPLLLEGSTADRVGLIVVVSAPAAIQRERLRLRPGMSEERIDALLARQMPDAEKRARAHVVIDTSGPVEAARAAVADLVRSLTGPGAAK